ncbi:MAG: hypothetical protein KKD17_02505 [Nanoarchaeota archaeon]|nr:hypothetical protein [Nanoarchaeota archaeon]
MLFNARKRHDVISVEELNDFRCDLSKLRQEIDDHLEAINSNTGEQEIQNTFICELDNRLNKVEEKVDELHFLLKQLVLRAKLSVELSKDEQRVFLILYTHEKFMKPEAISQKAFLQKEIVEDALTSMMDKGLPLEREIIEGTVYFRMNKEFKLRQAKEHIITIDPEVTSQFHNTLLNQFFTD